MNLPFTAPSAAFSIIASSNTMKGSLPPKSKKDIKKIREKEIFNIGSSEKKSTEYIIELLNQLKKD